MSLSLDIDLADHSHGKEIHFYFFACSNITKGVLVIVMSRAATLPLTG